MVNNNKPLVVVFSSTVSCLCELHASLLESQEQDSSLSRDLYRHQTGRRTELTLLPIRSPPTSITLTPIRFGLTAAGTVDDIPVYYVTQYCTKQLPRRFMQSCMWKMQRISLHNKEQEIVTWHLPLDRGLLLVPTIASFFFNLDELIAGSNFRVWFPTKTMRALSSITITSTIMWDVLLEYPLTQQLRVGDYEFFQWNYSVFGHLWNSFGAKSKAISFQFQKLGHRKGTV